MATPILYKMLFFFILIFTVTQVIKSFSQNCQIEKMFERLKKPAVFAGSTLRIEPMVKFKHTKQLNHLIHLQNRLTLYYCWFYLSRWLIPEIQLKNKWPIPLKKSTIIVLAPQRGLEPRTCWLTASRSTDWATGEHIFLDFPLHPMIIEKLRLLRKNFSGYIIQEQTDVNNFNSLFG